jgi:transcription antitermination factor NusG
MDLHFQVGDSVDVIRGDFAGFREGIVVDVEGELASIRFDIFGRAAGPVMIPLSCLRPSNDGSDSNA